MSDADAMRDAGCRMQDARKERPILFSGAMVRAILEGRKTQTRRMVDMVFPEDLPSDSPLHRAGNTVLEYRNGRLWLFMTQEQVDETDWLDGEKPAAGWVPLVSGCGLGGRGNPVVCPYGQPGDRLWVREAWRAYEKAPGPVFFGGMRMRVFARRPFTDAEFDYRADRSEEDLKRDLVGWKSPMKMPRCGSRILLEVTEVRVERVQETTLADICKEGLANDIYDFKPIPAGLPAWKDHWDSIHGEGAWDLNPWVWVVGFRVLEPLGVAGIGNRQSAIGNGEGGR